IAEDRQQRIARGLAMRITAGLYGVLPLISAIKRVNRALYVFHELIEDLLELLRLGHRSSSSRRYRSGCASLRVIHATAIRLLLGLSGRVRRHLGERCKLSKIIDLENS